MATSRDSAVRDSDYADSSNGPVSPSPLSRRQGGSSLGVHTSSLSQGLGMDTSISGSLAFKPPPKPGAARKPRHSISTGSVRAAESNSGMSATQSESRGSLNNSSLIEEEHGGSQYHNGDTTPSPPGSPASTTSGPSRYEGAPASDAAQTIAATMQCRQRLQSLRELNENELHAAGLLGNGLVEQRQRIDALMDELAEELNDVDSAGYTTDDATSKERITTLREKIDEEVEEMQGQRSKLYEGLSQAGGSGPLITPLSPTKQSAGVSFPFLSHEATTRMGTPLRTDGTNGAASGPTPRQSDRRARNAAARTSIADQGLVNQIQEGLVVEVRRLQALLLERDAELALVRGAKEEVEKEVAAWKPRALNLIESEDALKQENWDLSVARQDLEEKLEESQTAHKKAEAEKVRLNRELLKAREVSDAQRVQIDEATTELDKVRSLRETETALARKDRATMQRDMSDMQLEVQRLRERGMNDRSISRSVSNSLTVDATSRMLGIEEDDGSAAPRDGGIRRDLSAVEGDASVSGPSFSEELSPAVSPLAKRLTRDQEVQDLRAKLSKSQARAARTLADRRLQRDKNSELKRRLADMGAEVSDSSAGEVEDDDDWVEEPHLSTSGKRLARMRMPQSSTHRSFARRLGLGMPTQDTGAGEDDDDEEFYDDEGNDPNGDEPSVDLDTSAAQMSADGIDPTFGDALRGDFAAPASQRRLKGRRSTLRATQEGTPSSPLARGAVAGNRPASMIIEAGALGNELAAAGMDEPATIDESSAGLTDGSRDTLQAMRERELASQNTQTDAVESQAPVKILAEGSSMTEPQPDTLGPALRAKDEEHAATLGAKDEAHARAFSEVQTQHTSLINTLKQDHLKTLAELDATHELATTQLQTAHKEALDQRDLAHDSALGERDAQHASKLAAALAERTKTHENALTEARSRHTRALEEQVAAGSATLAAAELAHKKMLEQREKAHTSELDRQATSHASALSKTKEKHDSTIAQLKEHHEDMIHDLQSTHSNFVVQRDKAFNQAISDRDDALKASTAEVARLTSELATLRTQLAESRAELASSQGELTKSRDEYRAASETHRIALESAVAESRKTVNDTDLDTDAEGFEDARSEPHTAAVSQQGHDGPSKSSVNSEDDLPRTPADESGIRRVKLADLKDTSAQTDDQLWNAFQQRQQVLTSGNGLLVMGAGAGADQSRQAGESAPPAMFSANHLVQSERASTETQYSEALESLPQPDKTKPPSMAMPPPPLMPPPAEIPRRSIIGPPRPLSPPPPELVQRAQRSQRGSHLQVPGDRPPSRSSGAPPPSAYVPLAVSSGRPGPRPRTVSGESLGAPGDQGSLASGRRSVASRFSIGKGKGTARSSAASFASDVTSEMSRRLSVSSSRASDLLADRGSRGPGTSARGSNAIDASESTDPSVIHAITQTMIGEYLHKYTRRTMGRSGHSDKRHRRYFWIHPYNNTLYWSVADPAGAGKTTSTDRIAKSGAIQSVHIIEDNNDSPPGLFHQSIIIKTLDRDVKVTAPTRERHQTWVTALGYLIQRPGGPTSGSGPADETIVPDADVTLSPRRTRTRAATSGGTSAPPLTSRLRMLSPARSFAALRGNDEADDRDTTPRARGGSIGASTSLGKRRHTAAREYLQRYEQGSQGVGSPVEERPALAHQTSRQSGKRRSLAREMFGSSIDGEDSYDPLHDAANSSYNDPRLKTAEQMLEEDEKEGYEGLDNVRACCDGKHDVGSLAHKHHHHTHGPSSTRRGTNVSSGARSVVSGRSSFSGLRNSRPPSPSPQVALNLPSSSNDSSISARANAGITASKTDSSFARFFGSGPGSGFTSGGAAGGPVPSTPTSPGADSTNTDASNTNPSYTERVSQIRSARQSSGFR